jgi:hypothetical protein
MSACTPEFDNPLETACRQMRNLCRDGAALSPSFDQGSLARMLAHIDNISRSVIASTQDHANAAKRLNDFALIFERLARDLRATDEARANQVASVSQSLRAASAELSAANGLPNWRALDPGRS